MYEQMIGEVAGEVWRFLDRNGGRAELTAVRNAVKPPQGFSVDLGTGWLAREGKIYFSAESGTVHVGIRR